MPLAAVVQLAARCERRYADGSLGRPEAIEAIPWSARDLDWLASSLGYLRSVVPTLIDSACDPAATDAAGPPSPEAPPHMTIEQPTSRRIVSLDQFRGYTVAGMLLVNFLGGYEAVPAILKHHNTYCSYADTIMPQFFFAVGFAYRLTFLRRMEGDGYWAACRAALKRNAGLILLGFVIYHLDGRFATWAELRDSAIGELLARSLPPRAVPGPRPHRPGLDLGPAGDRRRRDRARPLSPGIRRAAPLALVVVLPGTGVDRTARHRRRAARVPELVDPAPGGIAGLRRRGRVPGSTTTRGQPGRLVGPGHARRLCDLLCRGSVGSAAVRAAADRPPGGHLDDEPAHPGASPT